MATFMAIDIETFSSVDLKKNGVYAYVNSPDFKILLFGYAIDNSPVDVLDLTQDVPGEMETLINMLQNPEVIKTAYNAQFERVCLEKYLGLELDPIQWRCTMVHAAMAGLPTGLEATAKALELEAEKDKRGKALIKKFCMPGKDITLFDGQDWLDFIEYCRQDVVVEKEIRKRLKGMYPITDQELELWAIDQRINDRGVLLDMQLVDNAMAIDTKTTEALTQEARDITGLRNPNSKAQIKEWLVDRGYDVESLDKAASADILKTTDCPEVSRFMTIHRELSKTSVKKYDAMKRAVCSDGRVRGLLQYYGASRTGRWAGRLVQVQNLPQNKLKDLDFARNLVLDENLDLLDACYSSTADVLSQLIRTAFIAPPGKRFIVADFSAIEARVIAWVAQEHWRQEVFMSHGKIYEASASQMFKVPIEQIDKGSPLRQKGKIAELALGYQGGVNALKKMGGEAMGLTEPEMKQIVDMWREANPNITQLWQNVEQNAISAVLRKNRLTLQYGLSFIGTDNYLFIELPSGRRLSYYQPEVGTDHRFNRPKLTFMGLNQLTKKWERQDTYGGKLVENIIQAIARDCLAVSMLRLEAAGYPIIMHVHDEVIVEAGPQHTLDEAVAIMGEPISWAPDLILTADGYETVYYRKD